MKHIEFPKLYTEQHLEYHWSAYLNSAPGMIATGTTEQEAIDKLMVSVKVKLLYDRDNL